MTYFFKGAGYDTHSTSARTLAAAKKNFEHGSNLKLTRCKNSLITKDNFNCVVFFSKDPAFKTYHAFEANTKN